MEEFLRQKGEYFAHAAFTMDCSSVIYAAHIPPEIPKFWLSLSDGQM